MQIDFRIDRTLAAWRDFALGLVLFLAALGIYQTMFRVGPVAFFVSQVLLVALTLRVHATLHRLGGLTEVTGTVMSFGRVSFARLSVAGAAVLAFMFGVWGVAQMIGGPIDRPLPLGPAILDRNAMPLAWLVSGGFYAIVMAPVMEELCFRGWMLRGLRHRFSPATAILIPAFLFAVLHSPVYSHPAYLLIPFALGITLGLVTERSRALWPAVVLHALWNVIMLALSVRNAATPLSLRAPDGALDVIIVLGAMAVGGAVLIRVLPATDDRSGLADPDAVLDTKAAA